MQAAQGADPHWMRSTVLAIALGLLFTSACTTTSNFGSRSDQRESTTSAAVTSPMRTADARVADRTGATVVMVQPFENPQHASVAWKDVGSGMSAALERTLLRQSDLDVWIGTTDGRRRSLFGGRNAAPEGVDIVVEGRLTDFYHTSDLSEAHRAGAANEAVVAIDVRVVDPKTGRVLAADHVLGKAAGGAGATDEVYRGVDFGSYAFWNTPLGRASQRAIDETVARLTTLVPAGEVALEITSVRARDVQLRGATGNVRVGDELFVFVPNESGDGGDAIVTDPELRRPLRIKVTAKQSGQVTGWLTGRAPRGVTLVGAAVRKAPAERVVTHE